MDGCEIGVGCFGRRRIIKLMVQEINPQSDENSREKLKEFVLEIVESVDRSSPQKITDTPKDAYGVVNRKYVTLNGVVGSRPLSSVAVVGQSYFNTSTNTPMVFDGNNWRNGVGSVVANGRNS